jgi:hypothetical protein
MSDLITLLGRGTFETLLMVVLLRQFAHSVDLPWAFC